MRNRGQRSSITSRGQTKSTAASEAQTLESAGISPGAAGDTPPPGAGSTSRRLRYLRSLWPSEALPVATPLHPPPMPPQKIAVGLDLGCSSTYTPRLEQVGPSNLGLQEVDDFARAAPGLCLQGLRRNLYDPCRGRFLGLCRHTPGQLPTTQLASLPGVAHKRATSSPSVAPACGRLTCAVTPGRALRGSARPASDCSWAAGTAQKSQPHQKLAGGDQVLQKTALWPR